MRKNLGWIIVVACCACGQDKGGGSPGQPPINGSLVVHTGSQDPVAVLLGDGSKYLQMTDAVSDAHFSGADLVGAQDITLVRKQDMITAAHVDRAEVWLPAGGASMATMVNPIGMVSGHVTGGGGAQVEVTAIGSGIAGSSIALADGSYMLTPYGSKPGPVDLFAADAIAGSGAPSHVGLVRGVMLDGTNVTAPDIALDRALDQTVSATVAGLEPYGGTASGTLVYTLQDVEVIFAPGVATASGLSFPSPSLAPPFDALVGAVTANAGDRKAASGFASAYVALHGTSASLSLLSPTRFTAPAVAPGDGAPPPGGPFRLAWTADPSALAVAVGVNASSGTGKIDWTIVVPAGLGAWSPPSFATSAVPFQTLPPTIYDLDAATIATAAVTSYDALFAEGGLDSTDQGDRRQHEQKATFQVE